MGSGTRFQKVELPLMAHVSWSNDWTQVSTTAINTYNWTALLGEEAAGDAVRVAFPKVRTGSWMSPKQLADLPTYCRTTIEVSTFEFRAFESKPKAAAATSSAQTIPRSAWFQPTTS